MKPEGCRLSAPLCLLSLLILTCGATAHAAPYGCPAYKEAQVTVTPLYVPPRYDDGESLSAIGRMAGESHRSPSGALEIPVGLTAASMALKSSFEVSSSGQRNDPMVCAQVTKFDLQFGFEDTTVYVARELPRHSCGYQAVLAHENRHVEADRAVMRYYMNILPDALRQGLRNTGVIRAASARDASERLRVAMDRIVKNLSDQLSAQRRIQQQRIDAPGEYERISASCNGEIRRIVSRAR